MILDKKSNYITRLTTLAFLFACSIAIVNLLINTGYTTTYKIFQAIECLRNLLEYNGSRDAHFKFSKWRQRFSIKRIIMSRVMDTRFDLQTRRLQSYDEAVFFLFQATLLQFGSRRDLKETWPGELS